VDLREYEQHKFAIAEILRGAALVVPEAHAELRLRLQDLFARLAEDRFNLVVVGRFSRGKTSLMNAILGSDRLPTGIAPLTSVITTVAYGSKEQVVLKYKGRSLDQEIPIKSLPKYITQQGNPGNIQGIKTAEVQLPAEILRRGFYFVDTPGLGSVIAENTLTTEAFLPEADAFILVTSFDSPLSEEEMRFFRAGSSLRRRIFVVLNKADLVPPEQREGAVSFIDRQLRTIFGHSPPHIFSVSATEGLMAKQARDRSRLATSGIPELENQLILFLLAEKRTEFLQSMCDRMRELLRQLPNASGVTTLRSRLDELADQFRSGVDAAAKTELNTAFSNLHRIQSCEICDFVSRASWDFICKYQYRIVVEGDEQERFAKRGGFCPLHTWEYESVSSPYGACNGYPHLLDQLSDELRAAGSISAGSRQTLLAHLQNLLPTVKDCVLCVIRDKAEQESVAVTARRLEETEGHSPQLSAICLPHLVTLVATILRRFSEDMRRYALKHDAVRRYMASREELTVAERGLRAVAGLRQVNLAPRRTGVPRCEEILAEYPSTRAGASARP
jgi:GTP-binding protein EngB required for normal cell division